MFWKLWPAFELKKILSVTKHGFALWAQRKPNAIPEIYKAFEDRLTFLFFFVTSSFSALLQSKDYVINSFVFEKSLNCGNEITNIVIFKRIKAQVLANKPTHFWTGFLFPKNVYKNLLKARPLLKCKQHIFLGWYIIGTSEKKAPRIEKSQKIYPKLYTFTGKKKTSAPKNSRLITEFL